MGVMPKLGQMLLGNLQGKAVSVKFIDSAAPTLHGKLFTAQDDYLQVILSSGQEVFVPFSAVAWVALDTG